MFMHEWHWIGGRSFAMVNLLFAPMMVFVIFELRPGIAALKS